MVNFRATVFRKIYSSDDFYIYLMHPEIEFMKLPGVKNKLLTISGNNIYELDQGVVYNISAEEVTHPKYGLQYKVLSISSDIPTDTESSYRFLASVLNDEIKAKMLVNKYPNIIDLIMKGKQSEIDVSDLKGIGPKVLEKISQKVVSNFFLVDVCSAFYNIIDFKTMKKLYNTFGDIRAIKYELQKNPYKAFMKMDRVGFKTADELLLKIDSRIKEEKKAGREPLISFSDDLISSSQRCLACIDYCLNTNEVNVGSTLMSIKELKAQVRAHVPQAYSHFDECIEDNEFFYVDEIERTIQTSYSRNIENKIAELLINGLKHKNVWNIYQKGKYRMVDGFELSNDQESVQEKVDKQNIVILSGYAGCVDCDTEFFNGKEWKKISEYNEDDYVLQYNEDGTANLVKPNGYVKHQADRLNLIQSKYGVDMCISDDHEVVYLTREGNIHTETAKTIIDRHNNTRNGFSGKFINTFDYCGPGISLSDPEIKLMCAVICDGSFTSPNTNHCRFHIKKDRKKIELRRIFEECQIDYKESQSSNPGYTDFRCYVPRKEKEFSDYWYNCNKHQLEVICDNVLFWDGSTDGIRRSFSTAIKQTADFIQFAFTATGHRSSIYVNDRTGQQYLTNGKLYERKSVEYQVRITDRKVSSIGGFHADNSKRPQFVDYKTKDGYQYCFNVPSHMWVMRRNGNIVVTHNCGKSSSMSALIQMLVDNDKSFALCSPSAKAAKVLENYTKHPAKTIHRLLGIGTKREQEEAERPLNFDIIIVDETSMVDQYLFLQLVKRIDFSRTKLLLLGDPYQLQSVGAGSILRDLIQSNCFCNVALSKIFRYGSSGILTVATDCRNNERFLPEQFLKSNRFQIGDSYMFCYVDADDCVDYLAHIYSSLLKTYSVEDIIVISPLNKGKYGTVYINNRLQHEINDEIYGETIEVDGQEIIFKKNDIVINTVNNYKSALCDQDGIIMYNEDGDPQTVLIANGETGKVIKCDFGHLVVKYENDYIYVNQDEMKNLRLAYAISSHKSQGSGYKIVILLTTKQHRYFLDSSLLYTSLTRAKEKIIHIGDNATTNSCVKKRAIDIRKTNLQKFLKEKKKELDKSRYMCYNEDTE